MSDFNNNFIGEFGFKTVPVHYTAPGSTHIVDSSSTKAASILYNFKQMLSYLPLISTIVGIASLVLYLSHRDSSSVRAGKILRGICDILYLVPMTFLLDTIANIGRLIQSRTH